jgi:hypothetical protein
MYVCIILGLPHNEVVPRLKEKVMDFKQGMPVITSLRNQFLRPRHWQQIERLIGKSIGKDKSFTLGSLLEMNVRYYIVVVLVWHLLPTLVMLYLVN